MLEQRVGRRAQAVRNGERFNTGNGHRLTSGCLAIINISYPFRSGLGTTQKSINFDKHYFKQKLSNEGTDYPKVSM